MKYAVLLLIALAGCDWNGSEAQIQLPARREIPTVNLPAALRQQNWLGSTGEGSCTHAVVCSLLAWQGRPQTAALWRSTHGNGETVESLAQQLDAAGIAYVQTAETADIAFLEWALSTCRGAGVTVLGGRHFVALVHLDQHYAGLLDPNDPRRILFVDRRTFLAEWRNSGSWATALLYDPAPPLPKWTY